MAMSIEYKGVSMSIPVPTRPPNDDVADPSSYIPSGMTDEQRSNLRAAAREFTNTIGGSFTMRTALSTFTPFGEAAENMYHFRHNGGEDKVLTNSEIEDIIEADVPQAVSFHDNNLPIFLELVRDDFLSNRMSSSGYLSFNTDRGRHWFGQYADEGEWYYAMGGFLMAYGAVANVNRTQSKIIIRHRVFIYDRDNWDLEKVVAFPGELGYALNDRVMNRISGLSGPGGTDYFTPLDHDNDGETDQYVVGDALMGSLQVTDGAQPFDIWGAGTIQTTIFDYPNAKYHPIPPVEARGGVLV